VRGRYAPGTLAAALQPPKAWLLVSDRGSAAWPCRKWLVGISVSAGLATVDVRAFAGDLGIHLDSSAGVLDGQ
jgi:hypothetical protein